MEGSSGDAVDHSTSTRSEAGCCRLQKKDWLKLISNIAIPLIIGIFTVFVSIHQQNIAQSNRDKDSAEAAKLRKEVLEQARIQRVEDNETAQSQRAEDKNIARLQRELDLNTTMEKLAQEKELAEKQRNLLESQRTHELQITYQNHLNDLVLEDERQKENILVNYQRQLATLLLSYGSTFDDPHERLRFVIQMKTQAALRLLNPARRSILVGTLYQANLFKVIWKREKSLLYKANVSGVHFGHPADNYEYDSEVLYDYLDIEQADARYATFRYIFFGFSPSFASSNLDYTDWSFSVIMNTHFEKKMTMNEAIFFQTDFEMVRFNEIKMNGVSFQHNKNCERCTFTKTSLLAVRLDNSNFLSSSFFDLSMTDSNMTNGTFMDTRFQNVILHRVDLTNANLQNSIFLNVSMVNCSLFRTILKEVYFSHVDMTGCEGLTSWQIHSLSLPNQVILPNGTVLNS